MSVLEYLAQGDGVKLRAIVEAGVQLHPAELLRMIDDLSDLQDRLAAAEQVIAIARTLGQRNSLEGWIEFWDAVATFDDLQNKDTTPQG